MQKPLKHNNYFNIHNKNKIKLVEVSNKYIKKNY